MKGFLHAQTLDGGPNSVAPPPTLFNGPENAAAILLLLQGRVDGIYSRDSRGLFLTAVSTSQNIWWCPISCSSLVGELNAPTPLLPQFNPLLPQLCIFF